jgi:hypothetical protein
MAASSQGIVMKEWMLVGSSAIAEFENLPLLTGYSLAAPSPPPVASISSIHKE